MRTMREAHCTDCSHLLARPEAYWAGAHEGALGVQEPPLAALSCAPADNLIVVRRVFQEMPDSEDRTTQKLETRHPQAPQRFPTGPMYDPSTSSDHGPWSPSYPVWPAGSPSGELQRPA